MASYDEFDDDQTHTSRILADIQHVRSYDPFDEEGGAAADAKQDVKPDEEPAKYSYQPFDDLPELPVAAAASAGSAALGSVDEATTIEHVLKLAHVQPAQLREWLETTPDWNATFQQLLDQMPEPDASDKYLASIAAVRQHVAKFSEVAQAIARLIIAQTRAGVSLLKPTAVGGIAGGEKFIVHGIFFKRVHDQAGLYGGEEGAARAALHELRGAAAILDANVPLLRTPMLCLVEFCGSRLLASGLLPLGKDTLVYGSADAGITIKTDPTAAAAMIVAGTHLNLASHLVNGVQVMGPADIEIHAGSDGRYYVLDTARVFPPAPPTSAVYSAVLFTVRPSAVTFVDIPRATWTETVTTIIGSTFQRVEMPDGGILLVSDDTSLPPNRWGRQLVQRDTYGAMVWLRPRVGEHLYQLLHPALVAQSAVPLSSDAFTGFGRQNATEHNNAVRNALRQLITTIIPQLARDIAEGTVDALDAACLRDVCRQRGISMRYLGILRAALPIRAHDSAREAILTQMVARFAKGILRSRLRSASGADFATYQQVVADFFSELFGRSPAADAFWQAKVLLGLRYKYGTVWGAADRDRGTLVQLHADVRASVRMPVLFKLLQTMTGVRLDAELNAQYWENPTCLWVATPVLPSHVVDIGSVCQVIAWDDTDVWRRLHRQHILTTDAMITVFGTGSPAEGLAHFAQAEVHRVAGNFAKAQAHLDMAWPLMEGRFRMGIPEISARLLSAHVAFHLGQFPKAQAHLLAAFRNSHRWFGEMTNLTTSTMTQYRQNSHPIRLVICERIIQTDRMMGRPSDSHLTYEIMTTLLRYAPPADMDLIKSTFYCEDPYFLRSVCPSPAERVARLHDLWTSSVRNMYNSSSAEAQTRQRNLWAREAARYDTLATLLDMGYTAVQPFDASTAVAEQRLARVVGAVIEPETQENKDDAWWLEDLAEKYPHLISQPKPCDACTAAGLYCRCLFMTLRDQPVGTLYRVDASVLMEAAFGNSLTSNTNLTAVVDRSADGSQVWQATGITNSWTSVTDPAIKWHIAPLPAMPKNAPVDMSDDSLERVILDMTHPDTQETIRVHCVVLRDVKKPMPTMEMVITTYMACRASPKSPTPSLYPLQLVIETRGSSASEQRSIKSLKTEDIVIGDQHYLTSATTMNTSVGTVAAKSTISNWHHPALGVPARMVSTSRMTDDMRQTTTHQLVEIGMLTPPQIAHILSFRKN